MKIIKMDRSQIESRKKLFEKINKLKEDGICPTCQNYATQDVFPSVEPLTFYEDEMFSCFLERYPRNPGHTIVLIKEHYEDISELPTHLGSQVLEIINKCILAIKEVLETEKVYLCTMCDGKRNHLHFQLMPRFKGDAIQGSKLFVKDRMILDSPGDVVQRMRSELKWSIG